MLWRWILGMSLAGSLVMPQLSRAAPGDEIYGLAQSTNKIRLHAIARDGSMIVSEGTSLTRLAADLSHLWTTVLNGTIQFACIGWDGHLYLSQKGEIKAVDLQQGDVVWTRKRDGRSASPQGEITVSPLGQIFVDGLAFDGLTGSRQRVWKESPGAGSRGQDLIETGSQRLFRLRLSKPEARDLRTAQRLWSYDNAVGLSPQPMAFGEDTVYLGGESDVFTASDIDTGMVRWQLPRVDRFASAVVDSEGAIYGITVESAQLRSLNKEGIERWRYMADEKLIGWPTLTNTGVAYVRTASAIHAVDTFSGEPRWKLEKAVDDFVIDRTGRIIVIEAGDLVVLEGDGALLNSSWPMRSGSPAQRGARDPSESLPAILSQTPEVISVDPTASDVSLEVMVNALPPIRYEWYQNGQVVENAHTRRLTVDLSTVTADDRFEVRVISGERELVSRPMSIHPGIRPRIEMTGSGRVITEPPGPYFAAGTKVTFKAESHPGRTFLGWNTEEGETMENPLVKTINHPETISAKFSSQQGDQMWEHELDALISKGALDEEGIFYGTKVVGELVAIDTKTRLELWTWHSPNAGTPRGVSEPVIGTDQRLFVIMEKTLWAMDRRNGAVIWERPLTYGLSEDYPPAIGFDGTLYLIDDKLLVALDPSDGSILWEREAPRAAFPNKPVITPDESLYVSGTWIDPKTGKTIASVPDARLDRPTVATPSVMADGTVIDLRDRQLIAASPERGVHWRYPIGDVRWTTLVGPDHHLYVVEPWTYLHVIDGFSGRIVNRFELKGGSNRSAALAADGTFYQFSASANSILAIDVFTGKLKWEGRQSSYSGIAFSPLIGPDGTVYSGGFSHSFCAFAGAASLASSSWPSDRGGFGRRAASLESIKLPSVFYQSHRNSKLTAHGDLEVLEVRTSGEAPFTYQWFHNAIAIENAKSSQLEVRMDSLEATGSYTATISNAHGSVQTEPLTLQLGFPVTINITGAGDVAQTPLGDLIPAGTRLTLRPQAHPEREFLYWEVNGQRREDAMLELDMNQPLQVSAFFSQRDGDVIWKVPSSELFAAFSAIDQDGILYAIGDGIQAIDPVSRNALWTVPFPPGGVAFGWDPMRVFEEHSLLVVSQGSNHIGIDLASGEQLWTVTGRANRNTFLVRNGLLYQSGRRSILVREVRTGKLLDSIAMDAEITFMGLGTDDMLYAVVDKRSVIRIDPDSKETLWILGRERHDLGDLALGPDGRGYVATSSGVLAFTTSTGTILWESLFDHGAENVVIDPDGNVYASGTETVTALNGLTGDILWQHPGRSGPAVVSDHGLVYVWSDGWTALEMATGAEQRLLLDREDFFRTAPLLGPDNRLYLSDRESLTVILVPGTIADSTWPTRYGSSGNDSVASVARTVDLPLLRVSPTNEDRVVLQASAVLGQRYFLEVSEDLSAWKSLLELAPDNNFVSHGVVPKRNEIIYYRIRVEIVEPEAN